jgi:hypothetical protein
MIQFDTRTPQEKKRDAAYYKRAKDELCLLIWFAQVESYNDFDEHLKLLVKGFTRYEAGCKRDCKKVR